MVTEEDRKHEIDNGASFFKAKTWEIRMLVNKNSALKSAAETLYLLNMDEQLRETCERFIRAEARENGYKNKITNLTAKVSDKNAEIAELKARLALLEKTSDK